MAQAINSEERPPERLAYCRATAEPSATTPELALGVGHVRYPSRAIGDRAESRDRQHIRCNRQSREREHEQTQGDASGGPALTRDASADERSETDDRDRRERDF